MLLYLKLLGIDSVITPNSGLILKSLSFRPFRTFAKLVFNNAKAVVCQGDFWYDIFSPLVRHKNKLHVVRNWISPEHEASDLPAFKIKDTNQIYLVYIGWLEEYKGLHDLIEAANLLKANNVSYHLEIWGEGSFRPELERLISLNNLNEHVTLKGWASYSQLDSIYDRQPILVLPSHFEGMPNIILEAMANGLPVIASNISTLPEMISQGYNGLLFDVNNASALSNTIEKLGKDILLQKHLRDNAKQSLSKYNLEQAANRLSALITENRKKVLMIADWFPPAYRAGGPIRSCDNLVQSVSPFCDMRIITSNKDLGGIELNVRPNAWIKYENASVRYASTSISFVLQIMRQMLLWKPSKIHLNGVFSPKASVFPLLLALFTFKRKSVIMSLRGMLMPSTLFIKSKKKQLYLSIAKRIGLFTNLTLHTTNDSERVAGQAVIPDSTYVTIPNLPNLRQVTTGEHEKRVGDADLIIIGRVHTIKNIHLLPECLKQCSGTTRTTLIGHLEDKLYLDQIVSAFCELDNHQFNYGGEVPAEEIPKIIEQNHALFLPSQSENYGHAIVETLKCARPVIISTNTPWRNLQSVGAGFDCPLDKPEYFASALQCIIDMDQSDFDIMSSKAQQYFLTNVANQKTVSEYIKLYS